MNPDTAQKDMRLPAWLAFFGGVFILLALLAFWQTLFVSFSIEATLAGIAFLALGVSAILCWKNQWAVMVDDDTFTYSTRFGGEPDYRFSDIQAVKRHSDSVTLVLPDGNVHVESCARLSPRFADALNKVVERLTAE